ncbi:hypothetical protein [Niallia sp. 03133]|uniref:hypothetical protein n=1 Tax=Niallia sp. 03133 TaxID=3458060 RepID=UPI004043FEDF
MKKFIFITSISFFSFLITSNNTFASEVEDSKEEIVKKSEDPVVANDGLQDGKNDPSSVNRKITKISDDPYFLQKQMVTFGANEWDLIGSDFVKTYSKVFYSGGGDLKMYIVQPNVGPGFRWLYQLMEEDPTIDDNIDNFELPNSPGVYELIWNVRSYVDGDNNKAEIYLKRNSMTTQTVTIEVWD